MLTRLCIAVMVVVVICGSADAQSLLLDKGERGPFFQLGYVWTEGRNPDSFGADLGYSFNDQIELGAGVAHSVAPSDSWVSKPKSVTTGGQFATLYPFKHGNRDIEFLLGVHEAYTKTFAGQESAWLAFGASLNLKVKITHKTDLLFSSGYNRATSSGRARDNTFCGLALAAKNQQANKLSLFLEVSAGNGPDSYTVGVGHTWVFAPQD